jgi:hypothetical protein
LQAGRGAFRSAPFFAAVHLQLRREGQQHNENHLDHNGKSSHAISQQKETQPLGFEKPNCSKFSPTGRSLPPPKPHIPCYDADGKIGGNGVRESARWKPRRKSRRHPGLRDEPVGSPLAVAPLGREVSTRFGGPQDQTFGDSKRTSALPPKADIRVTRGHVLCGWLPHCKG